MSSATWIRRRLVDDGNPRSLAGRARGRRWEALLQRFPDLDSMRVLDLGGRYQSWLVAPVRPASVTLLNVEAPVGDPIDGVSMIQGDACNPPGELLGERFDLVFSNSVIEHVGGHAQRLKFADTVYKLGDHHWVQTPYRYFPLEPHWVFPGFQFLPLTLRTRISAGWTLGWMRHIESPPRGYEENLPYVLEVELLSTAEMRYCFPRSTVLSERFAGLTKSLIATA